MKDTDKITLTVGQLKRLIKESSLKSIKQISESRRKYTQRELRDLVRTGDAKDITSYTFDEGKELWKRGFDVIGVSTGLNGLNGALIEMHDTGEWLAILQRNSLLSQLI